MSESRAGQGRPEAPGAAVELVRRTEEDRRKHLMLDPRPAQEMNAMVLRPMLRVGRTFWVLVGGLGFLVLTWWVTWGFQMWWGLGITGLDRTVMWGPYIAGFVYFIGLAEAGTFVAALLRVLNVNWRRPIFRIAELLTIFCLVTAALFPLVHLGRTWKFYWLLPYPNERQIWPSFHSALVWDITALLTYLVGSTLFFYIDLIPDAAMARDHTRGRRRTLYNFLAAGWRGTEKQWAHLSQAQLIFSYAILAVMPTVHTVVSYDFAMAIQPGWHSTIFGPYFVVGAIYSGIAAIIIAVIAFRHTLHLEYYIRAESLNGLALLLLLFSLVWDYFYFNDFIVTWYGQLPAEKAVLLTNTNGGGRALWWFMIFGNTILPFFTLWSRRIRTSPGALLAICSIIEVSLWIERYLITPVFLWIRYLPFDWSFYVPHAPEIIMTTGGFALIILGYVLSSKLIPIVPVNEVKQGQFLVQLRRVGRAIVHTERRAG